MTIIHSGLFLILQQTFIIAFYASSVSKAEFDRMAALDQL